MNYPEVTDELIYKTEPDLQILKTNMVTNGGNVEDGDKSGAWDKYTHTSMYKTDNQEGCTV